MAERLRVLQLGLGPIGREAARLALRRPSLELVGGVDIDPALAGRPLREILDASEAPAAPVLSDLAGALRRHAPAVVLQTTGSRLEAVLPQIETALRAGASVVSTAEELLFPFRRHPEESRRIDALAREHGASVLGTGVNPGFAMDTLAVCLSGVCREVRSVTVRRVVDAATRRAPLQRKIGAGLDAEEFRARAGRGELGHVGLVESLQLLADALGLPLDEEREALEPVLAERPFRTDHVAVEAGRVAGIHHTATGISSGRAVITLDLRMYVGAPEPLDEIRIDGDPPLTSRIAGGIAGDAATVAMLVNGAAAVAAAEPGLLTMARIAPVRWRA